MVPGLEEYLYNIALWRSYICNRMVPSQEEFFYNTGLYKCYFDNWMVSGWEICLYNKVLWRSYFGNWMVPGQRECLYNIVLWNWYFGNWMVSGWEKCFYNLVLWRCYFLVTGWYQAGRIVSTSAFPGLTQTGHQCMKLKRNLQSSWWFTTNQLFACKLNMQLKIKAFYFKKREHRSTKDQV